MLKLIAAGLLSLPALLLAVIVSPVIAILSLPASYLLLARKHTKKNDETETKPPATKVIVITGGSSGIGLAIAIAAAQTKSVDCVVILARNKERLQAAKLKIETAASCSDNNDKLKVLAVSVDVTDDAAVKKTTKSIMEETKAAEGCTHLFCCAGEPLPAYFQDVSSETYTQVVRTNQLGTIFVTNNMLEYMTSGTVTLCSSMGGQLGVFGFSAYSPTKFALRGYAECLHMELLKRDISIQVAYPPDTDTPGFEKENIGKPAETALISEDAGLATAEQIGSRMLREALAPNPPFNVYFNFEGYMVSTLTSGFSPVTTLMDAVSQVSFMAITRWIALFYLADWHRQLSKFDAPKRTKQESTDKSEKDVTKKD